MARHSLGWIGTGRMGFAICERLLDAGNDLWVYNRTRSKAEPLEFLGATVVDSPSDLGARDIVFTMVAGPEDVLEVTIGPDGVLSGENRPGVLVDSTTIDPITSQHLRDEAQERGAYVVAAPVSGNAKVVTSGKLTVVASGPKEAYNLVEPYLRAFGRAVTHVGETDEARLVKLCHNLHLGVVSQSLAEITLLAEAAGIARHDFLEFFNESVMGSTFTRYKSPALVNLDWKPTFTWHLLRKDLELGLEAGRNFGVPMQTAALVHQIVLEGIGRGMGDDDFAALLALQADNAGMTLESESAEVSDGL